MKSDIEIARSIELTKIKQIARETGIPVEHISNYGRYIAKVDENQIDEEKVRKNNLILVTAITPTKAGIGKTTVSIGLALGLNRIGKKAIVALREPSLGPCFGMKGGAAGGGYAQVLPMDKINLHFTGDFHAITSAHNMISALLDNYLYQNRDNGFGLKEVLWKRVLDVNDRSLRYVVTGLGPKTNGITQESGFDITPASEIMAILCLANDEDDLRRRIENILLGFTYDNKPFTVKDLGVQKGIANMDKHLRNLESFGQTVLVAFNRYGDDTQEEIDFLRTHCAEKGVAFAVNNAFTQGGEGAVELAELVVKTIEEQPSEPLHFAYDNEDSVETKISKVASHLYGADIITYSAAARKKLKHIEELGYAHFPICIAKTQYSFSTDPKLYGAVEGFEFHVQDIVMNAGAEMLVVIAGEIMRMPGLPKEPQALHIDIVNGEIEGLS